MPAKHLWAQIASCFSPQTTRSCLPHRGSGPKFQNQTKYLRKSFPTFLSSILLSQMSKLQTKEFTRQTQASSPLVPLQFDSAQKKRREKYPSMLWTNKNPTHYAHISPVLWKHWRHRVFKNAVRVHSSSKPNHKPRTLSAVSAIKWKNKRFMCALLPYSLSLSPFCPFILCQCVVAIVLTRVIDHSSGSAPTSLPSPETPLWNDSISSH